ncbi:MAG: M17 family peptidase N-terminal domain-containing protein, partial [Lapillicoccus sp.]
MPQPPPRRTTTTPATTTPATTTRSGAGTTLAGSVRPAAKIVVDTLLVGVTKGTGGPELAAGHDLPGPSVTHLTGVMADLGVTGRPEELTRLVRVPGVAATSVLLVGLGPAAGSDPTDEEAETIRRAVGAGVRSLGGTGKAAVCVPGPSLATATALAEGVALGAYAVTRETRNGSTPLPVKQVFLLAPGLSSASLRTVVRQAQALAEALTWCRDLVNSPPNLLYPESFADEVRARFSGTGVRVRVLDEKQLARGGYGGIVGVGQGSARPPRLVVLSYGTARSGEHVALVGKGITFDSGGLSIKPRASMPAMKSDMSGAAAVAGTMLALARLDAPVRVTAYLALAENMPGSNAQRAGDVVTMRGGMTVEVLDP